MIMRESKRYYKKSIKVSEIMLCLDGMYKELQIKS